MKRILTVGILAVAVLATGCTRIETGEVGVRVGFEAAAADTRAVICQLRPLPLPTAFARHHQLHRQLHRPSLPAPERALPASMTSRNPRAHPHPPTVK